ncbi:DUF6083 domain-containing protein [Streptomyces zaomyceticus]|uniref:DUF6083 domain-containing protein n=1 Tax=Streptomyces zaomyceticus TaxID=68286 RepID=UPI0036A82728
MRLTHSGRPWDGTPVTAHRRRALVIAHDSPSRLLRTAQPSRCPDCGNRIDWHPTSGHQLVGLHPVEVPSTLAPADHRWHLASGVAHPTRGGGQWCRLAHLALCPARTEPGTLPSALDDIRRDLALTSRRLADTGSFTPGHDGEDVLDNTGIHCRPARPIVHLLYTHYIAAAPVEDIRCVARNTRRMRCAARILALSASPGRWTLAPATPHRRGSQKLTQPSTNFAVYDLGWLPYSEQVRWRTQRCPTHAATRRTPGLALSDWELFDPIRHHEYLATRLPEGTCRRS